MLVLRPSIITTTRAEIVRRMECQNLEWIGFQVRDLSIRIAFWDFGAPAGLWGALCVMHEHETAARVRSSR